MKGLQMVDLQTQYQQIKPEIDAAIARVLQKGVFIGGEEVQAFATELGQFLGATHVIPCANGTDALQIALMALGLQPGDEVITPSFTYIATTEVIALLGLTPVFVEVDPNTFCIDPAAIEAAITPRTKAIVVINPNNPTGALYTKEVLLEIIAVARQHNVILFVDEIYDKMLFDGEKHISLASLSTDVVTITFNGLSKNYRSCGYRSGWMVVSGDKAMVADYIEGLNMLSSMRLCANVPGQYAIQTALGGYQSINVLVAADGGLTRQRDLAYKLMSEIPGVSVTKPKAALYLFPKLDPQMYPIKDDQQFIADLLKEEKVLLVQGTGFNWPKPDHFRITFLPHEDTLREAIKRIAHFLERYRMKHATNSVAATPAKV
jgi:alanine-synthesizing transaminase